MKCTLMNKNTEVLLAEYNPVSKFFDIILALIFIRQMNF